MASLSNVLHRNIRNINKKLVSPPLCLFPLERIAY